MKEPLKVGDRVKCYGGTMSGMPFDKCGYFGESGVITEIRTEYHVWVRINDTECLRDFHPKQLRRLKTKIPRRRFWVEIDAEGVPLVVTRQPGLFIHEDSVEEIEVIEVRKKDK